MNQFYVYVFLDPRKPGAWRYKDLTFSHEPFYVGCGKDDRMWAHFRPSQLKRKSRKCHKIRSIIESTGNRPIYYKVYEGLEEPVSRQIEMDMIQHFGREDTKTGVLTNHTDGGEGVLGYAFSPALRKQLTRSGHRAQKPTHHLRCVFKTANGKYECRTKINTKLIVRTYPTEQEAGEAYDRLALHMYGSDAMINFPEKREAYLREDLGAFHHDYLNNHYFTRRYWGVSYNVAQRKWRATVLRGEEQLYLGSYDDEEIAMCIVDLGILHLGLKRPLNQANNYAQYIEVALTDFLDSLTAMTDAISNAFLNSPPFLGTSTS